MGWSVAVYVWLLDKAIGRCCQWLIVAKRCNPYLSAVTEGWNVLLFWGKQVETLWKREDEMLKASNMWYVVGVLKLFHKIFMAERICSRCVPFLLQLSNLKGPVVFCKLLDGLGDILTLQLMLWPKRRCIFLVLSWVGVRWYCWIWCVWWSQLGRLLWVYWDRPYLLRPRATVTYNVKTSVPLDESVATWRTGNCQLVYANNHRWWGNFPIRNLLLSQICYMRVDAVYVLERHNG